MTSIITFFRAMPLRKKILSLLVLISVIAMVVLFFVFEKPIMRGNMGNKLYTSNNVNGQIIHNHNNDANNYFNSLAPIAEEVRDLRFGYLIIGGIIIASSIPPIPGYGSMLFICGFIYGFPLGFAIAYTSALIGSIVSFFLCRSICLGYARKLTKRQSNFQKLTLAIEESGFKIILLIRLSPVPFAWSNAFFGTIQTVSFWNFFLATALSLSKLLIHIFIGSRFGNLTEDMDSTSRIANYVSLAVGIILLFFAAWYIYKKMNASVEEAAAKMSTTDGHSMSEFSSTEFLVGDELVGNELVEVSS